MKTYSEEELIKAVQESLNMRQVLTKLGLAPYGGNYTNMKKKINRLKLDTSHWVNGWNKDVRTKEWTSYKSIKSIKVNLIRERGHQCDQCGRKTWDKEKINLDLHHIDGDRTNNNPSNLQLLCKNCHTMTPNWKGRKT